MEQDQPEKKKTFELEKTNDLLYIESDLVTVERWETNKLEVVNRDKIQAYVAGQLHLINILNWLLAQELTSDDIVKQLKGLTNERGKFLVYADDKLDLQIS